jgi:DNA-directed RNA polymerase subunit RPC12/RpoP
MSSVFGVSIKEEIIELDADDQQEQGVQYFCSTCQKYIDKEDLEEHHRNVHSGSKQQLKCLTCQRIFYDRNEFIVHNQMHQNSNS